jgi:hypothetical protein
MTRDDIIRMAREAGFARYMTDGGIAWQMYERFAALVAAAEREKCAKVCEAQQNMRLELHPTRLEVDFADVMARKCAAAIRARGQE